MAAIDSPRSAYRSAPVANRGVRSLITLIGKLAAWNDARMTRKVLNSLTDRELDDIGLSRGDIDTISR